MKLSKLFLFCFLFLGVMLMVSTALAEVNIGSEGNNTRGVIIIQPPTPSSVNVSTQTVNDSIFWGGRFNESDILFIELGDTDFAGLQDNDITFFNSTSNKWEVRSPSTIITDFNRTNIAYVNNTNNFSLDQIFQSEIQFLNGSFFFYNESNGTLMLFVNGELQQTWGSSSNFFTSLTINDNLTVQGSTDLEGLLSFTNVTGNTIVLDANLNATNISGESLREKNVFVCLQNGTHCPNLSQITNASFIPTNLVNKTTGTFFVGQLLDVIIDTLAQMILDVNNTNSWNLTGKNLFTRDLDYNIGIHGANPNASLHIFDNITQVTGRFCDDTVACYRFESGSGNIILDQSRFENNGFLHQGIFGNSLGRNNTGNFSVVFNNSGYGHIPSESQLDLRSTDDYTITAWINVSVVQGINTIVHKVFNGEEGYIVAVRANGRLTFNVMNTSGTFGARTATGAIVDNTWTHIAVTANDGTYLIYMDGVDVTVAGVPGLIPEGISKDLFIGASPDTTDNFNGTLDEILIFNRTLSAGEIVTLLNNGVTFDNSVPVNSEDHFRVEDHFIIDDSDKVGINTEVPKFDLDVNGSARFESSVHFDQSVWIRGVLFGGSPVKIGGGLNLLSGDANIKNGSLIIERGNITARQIFDENGNDAFTRIATCEEDLTTIKTELCRVEGDIYAFC